VLGLLDELGSLGDDDAHGGLLWSVGARRQAGHGSGREKRCAFPMCGQT
jgi:hypothetical protein